MRRFGGNMYADGKRLDREGLPNKGYYVSFPKVGNKRDSISFPLAFASLGLAISSNTLVNLFQRPSKPTPLTVRLINPSN